MTNNEDSHEDSHEDESPNTERESDLSPNPSPYDPDGDKSRDHYIRDEADMGDLPDFWDDLDSQERTFIRAYVGANKKPASNALLDAPKAARRCREVSWTVPTVMKFMSTGHPVRRWIDAWIERVSLSPAEVAYRLHYASVHASKDLDKGRLLTQLAKIRDGGGAGRTSASGDVGGWLMADTEEEDE